MPAITKYTELGVKYLGEKTGTVVKKVLQPVFSGEKVAYCNNVKTIIPGANTKLGKLGVTELSVVKTPAHDNILGYKTFNFIFDDASISLCDSPLVSGNYIPSLKGSIQDKVKQLFSVISILRMNGARIKF